MSKIRVGILANLRHLTQPFHKHTSLLYIRNLFTPYIIMTKAELPTTSLPEHQFTHLVNGIHNGDIFLFPTDTIWGIGCDATNVTAVQRIYDLKRRVPEKPYVLLVSSIEMIKDYVHQVHPRIETLLLHHKRPLSVVYPCAINLPPISVAQDGSVAIRVVQDTFCQKLINAVGRPLVATSANISNQPFPGNFGEISSEILSGVDQVVKLRQDEKTLNNPSVMITMSKQGEVVFLRK